MQNGGEKTAKQCRMPFPSHVTFDVQWMCTVVPHPLKLIFIFVIDAAAGPRTFLPTVAAVARFGLFAALLLALEALTISRLALQGMRIFLLLWLRCSGGSIAIVAIVRLASYTPGSGVGRVIAGVCGL